MRIFLFHKQQQCPINFDRQLGISHFKIQRGIKLCITSLPTFLSRDEHFARFLITGRELCQSVCLAPAWFRQRLSTTPLGGAPPVPAPFTPPLQLRKVNSNHSHRLELPALSTARIPGADKLCLSLPPHPNQDLFFFFFFCPRNLAPTPWVDQITLLKECLSHAHPPLLAQPN